MIRIALSGPQKSLSGVLWSMPIYDSIENLRFNLLFLLEFG